jgi:alkylated DNA repair dioxygenase AlkB
MSQESLFPAEPSASAPVAGFAYWPDVFTGAQERDWLRAIEALPFKPFEFHGYLGKRRIVSFGWRYDYSGRALRPSTPMPDFLEPLRQRAAAVARLDVASLQQALVTEYDAGVTIGWHRDKPMFEEVIALSFLSPCRLRLRRRQGDGWGRWATEIAPRSLYRLSGPARRDWEHSIPPVEAKRYSVTFRTFVEDFRPPAAEANSIQTGA